MSSQHGTQWENLHSDALYVTGDHMNHLVALEGDHDRSPQKLVCYSGFYMVV